MGDKIVKSKNLCCHPLVFTRCSLLTKIVQEMSPKVSTRSHLLCPPIIETLKNKISDFLNSNTCFCLRLYGSLYSVILCASLYCYWWKLERSVEGWSLCCAVLCQCSQTLERKPNGINSNPCNFICSIKLWLTTCGSRSKL